MHRNKQRYHSCGKRRMIMKRILSLIVLILLAQPSFSQDLYPAWKEFATYEYLYSCQHDFNRRSISEAGFLNGLARDARNELARQFEVRVNNKARLDKTAIDGRTTTKFASLTEFSTDVTLKLCEVKTHYEHGTGEGYAIAYINKLKARSYYEKEFVLALGKIDNALKNAENLIFAGSKIKARDEELTPAMKQFDRAGDALAWLEFFDVPESELSSMMERCNSLEMEMKQLLMRLEHATAVYLQCDADMFGARYPLSTEIRGKLNSIGCQYVDDSNQADWIVVASGVAEKFSEMPFTSYSGEAKKMYVADAKVNMVIKNVATGEIIYNAMIKAVNKGKDSDLSRAAEHAYSSIVSQIEKILKEELSK